MQKSRKKGRAFALNFAFLIFTFAFLKGYDAFLVGCDLPLQLPTHYFGQIHQHYCPFLPEVYYLD
jgi:hypothetical protein